MNLARLDLNLLVVFDALMHERNVTRAGQRIGLRQPATSNALARLRKLTQDPLFIRTSGGLQPTPTALTLAQRIQPALRDIDQALAQEPPFDPATSDHTFAIGMSDYTAFMILPRLLQKIGHLAPGVSIQVRTGDRSTLLTLLDENQADVLCGVFPKTVAWHHTQPLFNEQYVCLCRRDHPTIGDSLSLSDYLDAHHVLVSVAENRVGRIDQYLAQQSLHRHVTLSVPHFLVAPFVISQTDLVVTLASKVAQSFVRQRDDLKVLPFPLPLQGFTVVMRWHQSKQASPRQSWLRAQLTEVADALVASEED